MHQGNCVYLATAIKEANNCCATTDVTQFTAYPFMISLQTGEWTSITNNSKELQYPINKYWIRKYTNSGKELVYLCVLKLQAATMALTVFGGYESIKRRWHLLQVMSSAHTNWYRGNKREKSWYCFYANSIFLLREIVSLRNVRMNSNIPTIPTHLLHHHEGINSLFLGHGRAVEDTEGLDLH